LASKFAVSAAAATPAFTEAAKSSVLEAKVVTKDSRGSTRVREGVRAEEKRVEEGR